MTTRNDGAYGSALLWKALAVAAVVGLFLLPGSYTGQAADDTNTQRDAADQNSLGQKASDMVDGVKERLGIGEPASPASIYGHIEATDAATGSFLISGISGDFSAPSDIDITAFDGADAKVEVGPGGEVRGITLPDPDSPETPDKGLVGEIKDFVGMAGTTTIDGVLMARDAGGGSFQINGLETTFITPEDANVENLDGQKVRVEVDSHGQVESVSRHVGPDGEVSHEEASTTGS